MHILIIEDDARIGANLFDYLEGRGHQCDYAPTVADALKLITNKPDAVILDLNLPDGDGLALARRWQTEDFSPLLLILSARDTLPDKLAGFEAGADDYLVKPFSLQELEARLIALKRRATPATEVAPASLGPLSFDSSAHEIRLDGQALILPPKAIKLLVLLLSAPGRVFSRREIELAVWGHELESNDNLRSLMLVVRKALSASTQINLENVHGIGYRLTRT